MNRKTNVYFSILIPSYNDAAYLPRALDSVIKQPFSDFEIIVCNDCSKDNTDEIIKMYQHADPRICSFRHKQNKGLSPSRCDLIHAAIGKYIIFLDADDELTSDCLSKIHKLIEKYHTPDICEFTYIKLNKNEKSMENIFLRKKDNTYFSKNKVFNKCFNPNYFFAWSLWGKAFRSDFIKQYMPNDINFFCTEDLAAYIVLLFYAETYSYNRIPVVIYRFDDGDTYHSFSDPEKLRKRLEDDKAGLLYVDYFLSRNLKQASKSLQFWKSFKMNYIHDIFVQILNKYVSKNNIPQAISDFCTIFGVEDLYAYYSNTYFVNSETSILEFIGICFSFAGLVCKRWFERTKYFFFN